MFFAQKEVNFELRPASFPATVVGDEKKRFEKPLRFSLAELFHSYISVTEAPTDAVLRLRRVQAAYNFYNEWIAPGMDFELLPVGDPELNNVVSWAFGVAMSTLVMRKKRNVQWQLIRRRNLGAGPDFEAKSVSGYLVWEAKGSMGKSPDDQLKKARTQLKHTNVPKSAMKYGFVLHAPAGTPGRVIVVDPPVEGEEPSFEDWIQAVKDHYTRILRWSGMDVVENRVSLLDADAAYPVSEAVDAIGLWYNLGLFEMFLGVRKDVVRAVHEQSWERLYHMDQPDELIFSPGDLSMASVHGDGFVLALRRPNIGVKLWANERLLSDFIDRLNRSIG